MTARHFRIVYDLNGGRGAVFIDALTAQAARQLFLGQFPEASVVRISAVRS